MGEDMPGNFNDMKQRIDLAAKEAIEKRERVIKQVKNKFN